MNEVWIFADWNKLTKKEQDAILYMNITDVVLGIAMGPTKWNPTFTEKQLIEHVQWITNNNMRAHFMIWMYRKLEYIKDAGHWLHQQYKNCNVNDLKISSILFDCEKHWHLGKYMKLSNAISTINTQFDWAFNTPNLKTGVTGLAKLQPSVKPIFDLCDYGIGQGYAVWFPDKVADKSHFSHSEKYEPGNPEKLVNDTWGKHAPNKTIMGLACYYEKRPPRYNLPAMSQLEALAQSLQATRDMGYTRCAYWSLNHCIGQSSPRATRRDFIKQIRTFPEIQPPPEVKSTTEINQKPLLPTQLNCKSLQWLLTKLNYKPGPIDNKYGPKTKTADRKSVV